MGWFAEAEVVVVELPRELTWYSTDSTFKFDAHAARWISKDSVAASYTELSRLTSGKFEPLWRGALLSGTVPELAIISEDGKRVVAIGNQFADHRGDNIVVIYGENGEVIAHLAMRDFCVASPADRNRAAKSIADIDTALYSCFDWGCVRNCLEGGALELSMIEENDYGIQGNHDTYVVRVNVDSGDVESDVEVIGRPAKPDNKDVLAVLKEHVIAYPARYLPDGIAVDSRQEKCFFFAGMFVDSSGNRSVDLARVDTTGSIAWRKVWNTTIEQRPIIAVSDTVVYLVTAENGTLDAKGAKGSQARIRSLGHEGGIIADWSISDFELVCASESDRWLAVLGRDKRVDWPQLNALRLYNSDGTETNRMPGFANPSGATRMSFLNQDTLLVSLPDERVKFVAQVGSPSVASWHGYEFWSGGPRPSGSFLIAYSDSSQTLYNVHVFDNKIVRLDSVHVDRTLSVSGCFATPWTQECVVFGRTKVLLDDFDGYALKFRSDGSVRWKYEIGGSGFESVAAVMEPKPRRVVFFVLEEDNVRLIVCEQAYR